MSALLPLTSFCIVVGLFIVVWKLAWDAENAAGVARREKFFQRFGFGRFGPYILGLLTSKLYGCLAVCVAIGTILVIVAVVLAMFDAKVSENTSKAEPVANNGHPGHLVSDRSDRNELVADIPASSNVAPVETEGVRSEPVLTSRESGTSQPSDLVDADNESDHASRSPNTCGEVSAPCSVAELVALFKDRRAANQRFRGKQFVVRDQVVKVEAKSLMLKGVSISGDPVKCKLIKTSELKVVTGVVVTIIGELDKKGFSGVVGLNNCRIHEGTAEIFAKPP